MNPKNVEAIPRPLSPSRPSRPLCLSSPGTPAPATPVYDLEEPAACKPHSPPTQNSALKTQNSFAIPPPPRNEFPVAAVCDRRAPRTTKAPPRTGPVKHTVGRPCAPPPGPPVRATPANHHLACLQLSPLPTTVSHGARLWQSPAAALSLRKRPPASHAALANHHPARPGGTTGN